ncbi:MAG: glycoside hydrolase family 3 N-terminal domain-containing protein [Porphyromonas sp.]|nr:glycoside hydrolase family 3 N-terminal domain-containing protein [Porphyromonas sp.]
MRKAFFVLYLSLIPLSNISFAQSSSFRQPRLLSDAQSMVDAEWYADETMSQMTLEERLAQLIIPMIYPKEDAQSLAAWDQMVTVKKYGGVLWQKGTPEGQLRLTNRMRERAEIPMLVTMDGEWGLSMRLNNTVSWPRNLVVGATNSPDLAYQYGKATAKEARRMGIHVNFAPVLDVNSNPRNPVIGPRSFGSSPRLVADLGIAYSRGMEDVGVLSCAKHFPGHGDTDSDSHKTLPILTKSREELEELELLPFRAYIQAGLGGIMVGHLNIPALDPSGRATSASPMVVTDLLQRQMGFEGLIFTDGLGMQGIIEGSGGHSVAVEVFKAGSDLLLAPRNPDKALEELKAAVNSGEIDRSEVDRRCKKVLMWKHVLGVVDDRDPLPLSNLLQEIKPNSSYVLLNSIYDKAMTLVKNNRNIIPLNKASHPRIALLRYGDRRTPHLLSALKEYAHVEALTISSKTDSSERSRIYTQLKGYDAVVVAVTSEGMRSDAGLVRLASEGQVVLSFFTSPYAAMRYGNLIEVSDAVTFAYDMSSYAQRSMGAAIMGGKPFEGQLPVDLSPLFKAGTTVEVVSSHLPAALPEEVGMKSEVLSKIDKIAKEGVDKGAYPGCQVLVMKEGKMVYHKAFGYKDAAKREPNSTETLYDLASVTKAVVTTPLLMIAVDEGWLNTGDRIGKHVSYLKGSNKEQIRVSDLLFHTGGLPAIIRFYFSIIDKESYTSPLLTYSKRPGFPVQIARDAWVRGRFDYLPDLVSKESSERYPVCFAEGLYLSEEVRALMRKEIRDANVSPARYRYSDIDFLVLQDLLEEHYGKPLDQLYYERITRPLGTTRLCFKPYERFAKEEIAEGQRDDFLRKQTLRGYVDDEAAAMLGGVSGNAGLFGNASDLAKVLQLLLNNGFYDGVRYINHSTVKLFTTAKHRTSPYALGFDRHRGKGKKGNTCDEASLSTYGHTGFTGTSFWIDPEHDLVYVFLSNRVAPIRWNSKLSRLDIRKRIHSVIYEALS